LTVVIHNHSVAVEPLGYSKLYLDTSDQFARLSFANTCLNLLDMRSQHPSPQE